MIPYRLLLLLQDDEPAKHAPMRFTPGGCCPCGVQLLECILFGGAATGGGHQYELYLNDVLLGIYVPHASDQSWIYFSTQPNFPLVTPDDDWVNFHYDEDTGFGATFKRQLGAVFDPALLPSGSNEFRIKSIAGSGALSVQITIGPVEYDSDYPLPPDNPTNLYFEQTPAGFYYREGLRDITPPYDETITFTKP